MLPTTIWHDIIILNTSIHTSFTFMSSSLLSTASLIEVSSIPWSASSLMSSYHHPMKSTSWSSWWNTCFLSRSVNPPMRIPSKNLEDLAYPYPANVSFLTWCMMSLVLDDFFLLMRFPRAISFIFDCHRFCSVFHDSLWWWHKLLFLMLPWCQNASYCSHIL